MPASWPATIRVFSTKTDFTDVVFAAHINDLQEEVVAMQTTTGVNPHISTARAATYATIKARLEALESDYFIKSLLTTTGDLPYATGAGVVGRLPITADENSVLGAVAGVPAYKKVLRKVRKNSTGTDFVRGRLNFIEGPGVTIGIVDDAASDEVDVTISAGDTSALMSKANPVPDARQWAVQGEIKVASGQTDFIVRMIVFVPTGWTAALTRARHWINGGTSVTADLQKNGTNITGFTGISITQTAATTDPADVAVDDLDYIGLIVTAVSGTPQNLQFALEFRLTQT